jgi:ATP-binding cassette, subfamily B, bacterial MsbA
MNPNRLLLKFALRYPKLITLTAVLGFSGALFNGVSTALIVPVMLGFLGQDSASNRMPPQIQGILSTFGGNGQQPFAILLGVVLLAIVLKNIATYFSSISSARLTQTLATSIRKDGIRMLLDVDIDYYGQHKVGDIIGQLGGEVSRSADAIKIALQIFTTSITILVSVALLLVISWQLTLIATGLLLIVTLANQFFIKRAKKSGEDLSTHSREYSVVLLESLSGIRLIKSTSQEANTYKQLSWLVGEREKAELRSQANYALIGPINEIAGIATVMVMITLGRILFADQMASLSTLLLMYLFTLFRMLPFVSQLNGLRSQFANNSPSVQIIDEFLNRQTKPIMAAGQHLYTGLKKGIRFEDVVFSYPSSSNPVLRGVSVDLPRGTTLALVGYSGAGKSTLADLLPRFYDCDGGRITLDGRDLRDFDIRTLRRSMGIVSQETFLFNTTIFNNIAYGCHRVSESEVIEAAKRANAYEFISKMPEGFYTNIGDRGVLLSGGQRQRLAIARALLRNPDILILDEATSALDTMSERLVQQAIDELSRDRTVLVIAHRLSTIQKADQIAVFHQGQIVEVGRHDELLQQGGQYAKLYAMQFSESTVAAPKSEDYLEDLIAAQKRVGDSLAETGLAETGLAETGLTETNLAQANLAQANLAETTADATT